MLLTSHISAKHNIQSIIHNHLRTSLYTNRHQKHTNQLHLQLINQLQHTNQPHLQLISQPQLLLINLPQPQLTNRPLPQLTNQPQLQLISQHLPQPTNLPLPPPINQHLLQPISLLPHTNQLQNQYTNPPLHMQALRCIRFPCVSLTFRFHPIPK